MKKDEKKNSNLKERMDSSSDYKIVKKGKTEKSEEDNEEQED